MSSTDLHERDELLSEKVRDMHRALVSLMEELEAIDWYQQRVEATTDGELKAVLAHNRDEEIEHASMVLEWLRRHDEKFDANLRKYLFTEQPIAAAEEGSRAPVRASLGIGDLKPLPTELLRDG